jgi:hypothetical protein
VSGRLSPNKPEEVLDAYTRTQAQIAPAVLLAGRRQIFFRRVIRDE